MRRNILLFLSLYCLFSLASIFFPVDKTWYRMLKKPKWTPADQVIGFVWMILFALISISLTIINQKNKLVHYQLEPLKKLIFINYLANQLYTFFQFRIKNMFLASIDCVIVTVTSLKMIVRFFHLSKIASILLIPYFLWSSFASILSWTIFFKNR